MKNLNVSGYQVCTFCGSDQIIGKQSNCFTCQICHKDNYINCSSAVGVFFYNEQGQVLIAQRARDPDKGKYDDPGGFIDLTDQSVEQALVREISEELGIHIDPLILHYLGSEVMNYVYQGRDIPVCVLYFTAFLTSEECASISPSDDVAGVQWVNDDTFDSSNMVTPYKASLVKRVFELVRREYLSHG